MKKVQKKKIDIMKMNNKQVKNRYIYITIFLQANIISFLNLLN